MSDQDTIDTLRTSSFFSDLPEDQLQQLLTVARFVEFRPREVMFQEYGSAKDVFLITSGKVGLLICNAGMGCRQIMEVNAGDLIGWSPLLDRPRLSDTARTLTSVRALAFDGAKLRQLCEENPQFGYQFMRRTANILAERLNALRWQLVDLHGTNLPEVVLESD